MSIDRKVRKSSQITPHKSGNLIRLLTVSIGVVTVASLLTAGYRAYQRIPEGKPNVNRFGYTLEIEPPTYTGNYLTRHSDGRTTVMLVGGLFSPGYGPYRWYKDTKGDGKVHEIDGDLGNLKREKNLMDKPGTFGPIFAEADRLLQDTVEKYKPKIDKFHQDIQMESMF